MLRPLGENCVLSIQARLICLVAYIDRPIECVVFHYVDHVPTGLHADLFAERNNQHSVDYLVYLLPSCIVEDHSCQCVRL